MKGINELKVSRKKKLLGFRNFLLYRKSSQMCDVSLDVILTNE
jgi:hypothetical protein